jgi:hypothetical protein
MTTDDTDGLAPQDLLGSSVFAPEGTEGLARGWRRLSACVQIGRGPVCGQKAESRGATGDHTRERALRGTNAPWPRPKSLAADPLQILKQALNGFGRVIALELRWSWPLIYRNFPCLFPVLRFNSVVPRLFLCLPACVVVARPGPIAQRSNEFSVPSNPTI